jgi:SAM-dependent methyltransferase
MNIKSDWYTWLHAYKEREIEKVFSACPERCFARGLELGAGDGFQSVLLSKYIGSLVSTEINKLILTRTSNDSIEYATCSAEEAVGTGRQRSFDIVYSSNLLEHLIDPVSVLRGIHRIMKDDGITVHIMPAPLWKFCQVLLYVPVNVLSMIEHIARERGRGNRLRETRFLLRQLITGLRSGANTMTAQSDREAMLIGNNPESAGIRPGFIRRLLLPLPHGRSATNRAEFAAFRKRRWIKTLNEAGFDLIAIRKGPAASGYGLGWAWVERLFEKAGLGSELIYIAQKKDCESKFKQYF